MVKVTNRITREFENITFFPDDTVETVLQRIGEAAGIHPDRLFVTVSLKRPKTYYSDDPRRWEALFNRLSYGGKTVLKLPLQLYQTYYRYPQLPSEKMVNFEEFGRNEWSATPVSDELFSLFEPDMETFNEHLIFGVEESMSYILPLTYDPDLTRQILGAAYPVPQKATLISTLYPDVSRIEEFTYTAFDQEAEASKSIYFPFLQSSTPERLPETTIQILHENTDRLKKLMALPSADHKSTSIVRARFRIPFVETKFGPAVHNRFEQMFYGLTVSEETPCISFFTSPEETSRHKFFVKSNLKKKPEHLDWWKQWWTATKPYKHKPTLVLYHGKSSQHYDRIAITSSDMIIMSFRPEGVESDVTKLKSDLADWIKTLDSVLPFTNPHDFNDLRWETQDLSLLLKYKKKLTEYDLHRFNCMTSIFDMSDAEQSTFRLLRTDHSVEGLTSMDVRILQMTREKTNVSVADIQSELGVSLEVASALKTNIQGLTEENPNILNRSFRGFPTMRLGTDTVFVSSTTQFTLAIQYANILRFILGNTDPVELNKICPARKDIVPAQTRLAPAQNIEVNTELMGEYESLFEGMEEDEAAPKESAPMPQQPAPAEEAPAEEKLKPKARATLYNYFNTRLQKFDSNTFVPEDSEYPKKCEQKHQPIVLSDEDLERIKETPYDPTKYMEERKLKKMEDPNGTALCPEYWCMTDEIPLRKEDLNNDTGVLRCPECNGKVRTSTKDDAREFSVIERDAKFAYPGNSKHKSPKNARTLPCCYKKPDTENENTLDHFYIISDDKYPIPKWRCAMLPLSIFNSLRIPYERDGGPYKLFEPTMRITKGTKKGHFFRVGLGRPAKTLPRFLGLKNTKILSPRDSIETILKCSFVATCKYSSDANLEDIMERGIIHKSLAKIVSGIDEAFQNESLSILEELEYASVSLGCDVFRIFTETMTLACSFYSPRFKKTDQKAIVVLQHGNYIDILSHVRRKDTKEEGPRDAGVSRDDIPLLEYAANIHDKSLFEKTTYDILNALRINSCSSSVPTYTDALRVMDILGEKQYSIIADPYGRAQAFYIEEKLILPFRPTPIPPDSKEHVLDGYTDIKAPTYEVAKQYLSKIPTEIKGYDEKELAYNQKGELIEIILGSGLRVPVAEPETVNKESTPKEVIQTVQTVNETNLTFGDPDELIKKEYADVSYASEVFDFLLFELSKDLKEEATDLRKALDTDTPRAPDIDPLLDAWFKATTTYVDITSAEDFVSKVRKPCGQFKKDGCNGNVCAWNGNTCQVKVRNSVNKKNLYNRLLSSLVGNPKIRYAVLEGRNSPFFSTILYVELPHELIVTDVDLASLK